MNAESLHGADHGEELQVAGPVVLAQEQGMFVDHDQRSRHEHRQIANNCRNIG